MFGCNIYFSPARMLHWHLLQSKVTQISGQINFHVLQYFSLLERSARENLKNPIASESLWLEQQFITEDEQKT